MRLHRRFGDIESLADLFVGQAGTQHLDHTKLLRREFRHETGGLELQHLERFLQAGLVIVQDINSSGHPHATGKHGTQRFNHGGRRRGLRHETGRTVRQASRDNPGLLPPGNNHDRNGGQHCASSCQRAESLRIRQVQIQQHEIDSAIAAEDLLQRGGRIDLCYVRAGQRARHGERQRFAKQRQFVGDHNVQRHVVC